MKGSYVRPLGRDEGQSRWPLQTLVTGIKEKGRRMKTRLQCAARSNCINGGRTLGERELEPPLGCFNVRRTLTL